MKNTENKGFDFFLPFDPFRLLLAVLERFGMMLLVAGLCGALGVVYAVVGLGNTYTATIEMVSEGWRSSRSDERTAYVPMPITHEGVVIASRAENVFEMAAKRVSSGILAEDMRDLVKLQELPGDGLFSVVARTREGREVALEIVEAYAAALMDYTAQLRRDEARSEQELLEKQLEQRKAAAKEINDKIVKYSSEEGIFDVATQTGPIVAELSLLKKSLSEAQVKLQSNDDSILNYIRTELVAPLNEELGNLLRLNTDENSLVKRKREEIRNIEEKIELNTSAGGVNLKDFESLLDGRTYNAVQRLQEDRRVLENQIASYVERIGRSEAEIGGLPEKSLAMSEMKKVLDQRLMSSAVINGQMKDAEFYAENAPPALGIFHVPTLGEVEYKSVGSKAVILGALGMFAGAGAVVGLSLLMELIGRSVRTPMQAAIAAGAYPKLVYPPSRKTPVDIALRGFWIRGIARFLPGDRRMIFPVIGELPNEVGFWGGLFDTLQDEKQRVVFVDFSTRPLDLALSNYDVSLPVPVSRIDPFQYGTADLKGMAEKFPEGHVLIIRWDMNPTSMLADLAPHIDRQYILTSQEVPLSTVEEESRIYREIFGDADGLVLVNSRRPKRSQLIVNRLQDWYLEAYRRKSLRETPPIPAQ